MAHDSDGAPAGAATPYEIVFPEWYDDAAELSCAAQGFFNGPTVVFGQLQASLTVYDQAGLARDVEAELGKGGLPCAYANLLVLREITRAAIVDAVAKLHDWGEFEHLAFEGRPKPEGRH